MKVASNIVSIEAWVVDVQKVKNYLDGEAWNDYEWVKPLIDDSERTVFGKRGIEYFPEETMEVDYDEFKTYPVRLMFNGGAVLHDGDYLLRCERDYRGEVPLYKNKPVNNIFYEVVHQEEFSRKYIFLE